MKYLDLIMTIKIYFCNYSHILKSILVIYTHSIKSNFDVKYRNNIFITKSLLFGLFALYFIIKKHFFLKFSKHKLFYFQLTFNQN
jgi:hypothetical protein